MLASLALALLAQSSGQVDLARLIDELGDRSALARLPDPPYRARSTSSRELPVLDPADEDASTSPRVLLDTEGPGVITRIWFADPSGELRVLVDRDDSPFAGSDARAGGMHELDCELQKLFSGAGPVAPPLASLDAHGGTLLLPIPFAKRLRILHVGSSDPRYEIEWRAYASDVLIPSSASASVASMVDRVARAWAETSGDAGVIASTFHLSRRAPEGELLAQDCEAATGPRAISEIRLKIDAADPTRALTTCTLRMTFDGEETVALPLGALFGALDDLRPKRDRFTSVDAQGELVARFVMPYEKSFGLAIDNAGDPELHVSGSVRTIPWAWDERSLHFHASWRSTSAPSACVVDAHVAGRGVYVGERLFLANPTTAWWGEGGASIRAYDATQGRMPGPGAAAAYGFGDRETTFARPLHGRPRRDGPHAFGRTDLYRFRALDAVPFERELEVAHELRADDVAHDLRALDVAHEPRALDVAHEPRTDSVAHDPRATPDLVERAVCSVYYARPGAKDAAPPLPRDPSSTIPRLRFESVADAVEAESARVVATSPGIACWRQARRGAPWSAGLQLAVEAERDGEFVELEIPARPGRSTITVLATRAKGDGRVRFSVDGRPIEPAFEADRDADGIAVERVELGVHDVGATFRLRAELLGSTPDGAGSRRFGLDAIVVRPTERR